MESDEDFMRLALQHARRAIADKHCPCGCVLVSGGEVVAVGRNGVYQRTDPTRHGELAALEAAFREPGRDTVLLTDVTAYVTAEPCIMCAGAFLPAGIPRVVFGAHSPDFGTAYTGDILRDFRLTDCIEWVGGVLGTECQSLLEQWADYKRGVLRRVSNSSSEEIQGLQENVSHIPHIGGRISS